MIVDAIFEHRPDGLWMRIRNADAVRESGIRFIDVGIEPDPDDDWHIRTLTYPVAAMIGDSIRMTRIDP